MQEEEHNRLLQQTEQVMQKRKERMRQFKHNRKQEQERLKCAQSARLQKNKKLPQSQQRMQVAHRKKW